MQNNTFLVVNHFVYRSCIKYVTLPFFTNGNCTIWLHPKLVESHKITYCVPVGRPVVGTSVVNMGGMITSGLRLGFAGAEEDGVRRAGCTSSGAEGIRRAGFT
jgi:hypothetical protein